MTLYDSDATTVLDVDDNSGVGFSSLIEIFNETQRVLYIRIAHRDGDQRSARAPPARA